MARPGGLGQDLDALIGQRTVTVLVSLSSEVFFPVNSGHCRLHLINGGQLWDSRGAAPPFALACRAI
jgi:hypothetical protein